MFDKDSKLIFESYRANLLNEEFNPEVVASKVVALDPQAGRDFLHNLKAKDENRFMEVMKNILSGQAVSDIINKFKNEAWPKIKAVVTGTSPEDGELKPVAKNEDEIDVKKSDINKDGELEGWEKARGAAIDKAMGGNGKMPERNN